MSQGRAIFAWLKGWRHLAKSYEFVESLERFLLDLHKKGWPLNIEDLPRPPEGANARQL